MMALERIEETWVISLHFGTVGGWPARAAYLIAGLIPLPLMITGLVVWWKRGDVQIEKRKDSIS